jgi:hypothetical protein
MNCPDCGKEIIDIADVSEKEIEVYSDALNRVNTVKSLLEVDKLPFDMLAGVAFMLYSVVFVVDYYEFW